MKLRFFDIIKALSGIVLKSSSKDERSQVESIKTKILNFEIVFLCEFMHHVLNDNNYETKTSQRCDINLDEASRASAKINTKMQIYRNYFESFKYKARGRARKYGIVPNLKRSRQRKVEKYFDELASDYQFHNRKKYLKLLFSRMY
ncbi:hypothetical protein HHI36_007618 [Cryptolaemus montrouzieri]|uniref:Uncharacterized protein n=1 Tax=Cryptolaemus montrouzieri TaxID=559131 RepID=A0ABD2MQ34_9CUCU